MSGSRGWHPGPDRACGWWLRVGGTLVIDDFTPFSTWPPRHDGQPDLARLHWLTHPSLLAMEIRTEPDAATIVATLSGAPLISSRDQRT